MAKRLLCLTFWISTLFLSACINDPLIIAPPTPPSTTLIASHGITILFPEPWTAIDLDSEDISARLTALQNRDDSEAWQTAVAQLTAATGHDSMIAVALYEDQSVSDFMPNLTVMLLPRNGLSLRVYLQESERMLEEMAGVAVERAEFDDSLLSNGAPVATLHYVLGGTEQQVASYQALFFDATAEHVVVMTFAAALDDFEAMLPVFQDVVRAAE